MQGMIRKAPQHKVTHAAHLHAVCVTAGKPPWKEIQALAECARKGIVYTTAKAASSWGYARQTRSANQGHRLP